MTISLINNNESGLVVRETLNAVIEQVNTGEQIIEVNLFPGQLNTLFSSPVPVIPAPANGEMIVINSVITSYRYGTITYQFHAPDLFYGNTSGVAVNSLANTAIHDTESFIQVTHAPNIANTLVNLAALPIVFADTSSDQLAFGAINVATVTVGGTNYAPGDTGSITTGSGTARYVINTVTANVVTGFSVTNQGNTGGSYQIGSGQATANLTGVGTGFTVNVQSIIPADGNALMTISYVVVGV